MKKIVSILSLIFLFSCTSKYSKENHKSTNNFNDSLFIEKYLVYNGGVFASNSYTYYLTDSLNFRAYLYTITEDSDGIKLNIHHNILYVYKVTPRETIEVNRINITEVKREGVFE